MDTDRAYLLGLIVGGGIFGNAEDVFRIRLPFRQWGSYIANPQRAGQIANDVLRVVSPLFRSIYGLTISYDVSVGGEWNILCEGDLSNLKTELQGYGISCEGAVRKTASINSIIPALVDDNLKRRFIAGLADTIGSTTPSHRRFSDDIQILSFEINGFQYGFVCQLCRLLHSVQCYPDQVLWNHPNFHSGNNPYYLSWKKGFKLRVKLDQYARFGAFAFRTKVESARENIGRESRPNVSEPCQGRKISVTPSCVHIDENYVLLPPEIRGGHYLHNKHVCAVLGCEHAPYEQVEEIIAHAGQYINPFPIICKGTIEEIDGIVQAYDIYRNREYRTSVLDIEHILRLFKEDPQHGLFPMGSASYPINFVVQAIAFLLAGHYGKLGGVRVKGSQDDIFDTYLRTKETDPVSIELLLPEIATPLILKSNGLSAMVGPMNPVVYQTLVNRDETNTYKITVRPITEDDLK